MSARRDRLRKRVVLTVGLLSLGLALGLGLTKLDFFRRAMILREHRQLKLGYDPAIFDNGWGWAERSQLHSSELGPWLLRDPEVVSRRIAQLATRNWEQLYKYAGEWALMFAALRLQGLSNEQILGGPEGLSLTLATLAAEADPPAWWGRSGWLALEAKARPSGSFRMGLLGRDDVVRLLGKIPELREKQASCFVVSVLRHDDGFDPAERDLVLAAWSKAQEQFYNKNNTLSVQRAVEAREGLRQLLSGLGDPGGELTLQMAYPEEAGALVRKRIAGLYQDFVRSLGYAPRLVDRDGQVRVAVDLLPVSFDSLQVDHFEPYETTERVSRPNYGAGSKYAPRVVWEDQKVIRNQRKSEIGSADILSYVATFEAGSRAVTLALPPHGEVRRDIQEDLARFFAEPSPQREHQWDIDYYLSHGAARPWRFGLDNFVDEWELEETR